MARKWFPPRPRLLDSFRDLAIVCALGLSACTNESRHTLWADSSEDRETTPSLINVAPHVGALAIVVAPDNTTIVAVGAPGTILRSDNGGASWTSISSGTQSSLTSAVFLSPNTWVAVGRNGAIVRSIDNGKHWLPARNDNRIDLNSVVVLQSTLIAVGDAGAILRSVDQGAQWTAVDPPAANSSDWVSAAVDSTGAFAVVGYGGKIARSLDGGTTWVSSRSNSGSSLIRVMVAADGSLIAIGTEGSILRSTDHAATWSVTHAEATKTIDDLTVHKKHVLIAVADDGAILRSIDNGIHWSAVSLPTGQPLRRVVSTAQDILVAFSSSGTIVRSTDDGLTWSTPVTVTDRGWATASLVSSTALIAVDEGGRVLRSLDGGGSWIPTFSPIERSLNAVTESSLGAIVAVGDGELIVRSTDHGEHWSVQPVLPKTTQPAPTLRGIAAGSLGTLIAVGDNGMILRSTDNGIEWSRIDTGTAAPLARVLSAPRNTFVAVGKSLLYSLDDGEHWTSEFAGADLALTAALQSGDSVIAIGERETIVRSADLGASWSTVFSMPTALTGAGDLASLALGSNGTLVAVGSDGLVLRSTDAGAHWATVNAGTDSDLISVAAEKGPNHIFVTASTDRILRSGDDGLTWSPATSWVWPKENTDMGPTAQRNSTLSVGKNRRLISGMRGDLLSFGGRHLLRSIDDGRNWSSLETGTSAELHDLLIESDGRIIAVGDGGEIVRTPNSGIVAPKLRRIDHDYDLLQGVPVLHLVLLDDAGSCPQGRCVSVEARSLSDKNRDIPPRPIQTTLIAEGDGQYALYLDPSMLGAQHLEPLFVRLQITVPGFSQQYPLREDLVVPDHGIPVYQQYWFLSVLAALMCIPAFLILLMAKPLLVLRVMSLPTDGVTKLPLRLFQELLQPIVFHNRRVLDAWIAENRGSLIEAFHMSVANAIGGTSGDIDRNPSYVPLPIDCLPEKTNFVPTPDSLYAYFHPNRVAALLSESHPQTSNQNARALINPRVVVQIVGRGGIGKTTLAAQIGRWIHGRQLNSDHCCVLFLTDESTNMFVTIENKVRAILPRNTSSPQFIRALLEHGRLWLVIDSVSERSLSTQQAIANMYTSASPRFTICTTRWTIPIADGPLAIELRPRSLDASTLTALVEHQIRRNQAAEIFPTPSSAMQLGKALADLLTIDDERLPITPLLVRIFVDQVVVHARKLGRDDAMRYLPATAPGAYFNYVEALDSAKSSLGRPDHISKNIALAAQVIARVQLGADFRPKPVDLSQVEDALRTAPALAADFSTYISRLEACGLLTRRRVGGTILVQFCLDSLAEYLAAFAHAAECASSLEKWNSLLQSIAEHGEAAEGFGLALHMTYAAYSKAFGYPKIVFPKRLQDIVAGPY